MAVEVFMSKMSDHMETGEIIRWLVSEGDRVEQGQIILEVETDKTVAELEAPASGILKGIRSGAEAGITIPVGETFAYIAAPDEEVPVLPPLVPAGTQVVQDQTPVPTSGPKPVSKPSGETRKSESGPVRASPAARRVAKALGIELSQVPGSGPGGRITEDDVRAFDPAQTTAPAQATKGVRASPVARRVARELGVELAQLTGTGPNGRITEEDVRAYAKSGPSEDHALWLELTPVQRLTGERMVESVQTAPQFALSASVDMTNTLGIRETLMEPVLAETKERLSITAILIKVVATALKDYPRANATFEAGRVKLYPQINVGVAVGTDDGLVVPVVKEADQRSLAQITQELGTFQEKVQQMRFSRDELSGGTFTISNLGMYGIDHFNAIINPPQSAILAVGRIIKTPLGMPDDTIALRPLMNLTLTVDHRSLDGIHGARFLALIKERLEKPDFLLDNGGSK